MCTKLVDQSLTKLRSELEEERKNRLDMVVKSDRIRAVDANGGLMLRVQGPSEVNLYSLGDVANMQISQRLGIPLPYYRKCLESGQYGVKLLAEQINYWMDASDDNRMLRVMGNECRAFLSDKYRRLDNLELFTCIEPTLRSIDGLEIVKASLTDTHMVLKITSKRLKGNVALNDPVQAGFCITSSELGLGAVRIENYIWRLVCKNGLVCPTSELTMRKLHLGKQHVPFGGIHYLPEEIITSADREYFNSVARTVSKVADMTAFQANLLKLRQLKEQTINANPLDVVDTLGKTYLLTNDEKNHIFANFVRGKDASNYGWLNAITATARTMPELNRATELERIAGKWLEVQSKYGAQQGRLFELPDAA